MINVSIIYDNGSIREFSVDGHAGYSESGRDIVCAAVSAVTQTAVIGLTEVLGLKIKYEQKDGWLRCVLPGNMNSEDRKLAGAVLNTMLAGLQSIQYSYKDYISIKEKEVR